MALMHGDLTDEEFIETFEEAAFAPTEFPHEAHLRMAWIYVRHFGRAGAVERATAGIRRLAAAHGHAHRYHDTMTRAWVYLIAVHVDHSPAAGFEAFLDASSDLRDRSLLLRHYTPTALSSPSARAGWVAPDSRPIPGAPSMAAQPRGA